MTLQKKTLSELSSKKWILAYLHLSLLNYLDLTQQQFSAKDKKLLRGFFIESIPTWKFPLLQGIPTYKELTPGITEIVDPTTYEICGALMRERQLTI